METISELENDCKTSKQALERLSSENDRVNTVVMEQGQQIEVLESQRKQMKKEIKELKFRESRNMSDYSELEEENISLQKSLLQLKQAQVDYEAVKYENKRYKEELEELNAEIEELIKLKKIVESNLEEALVSLQLEREQKHAIKKELDQRITNESMFNLHSLAQLGLGDMKLGFNEHNNKDEQDTQENPALKQIEADFSSKKRLSNKPDPTPSQGLVGDLFSEIHLTEVRKLEQVLESTEFEKSRLEQALLEAHANLEEAKAEITEKNEKISELKSHFSTMATMTGGAEFADVNDEEDEDLDDAHPEISAMKRNLKQQERKYCTALKQIGELQEQLKLLQDKMGNESKEGEEDIRDEVTKLRNKTIEYEETIKHLEEDFEVYVSSCRRVAEQHELYPGRPDQGD